LADLVLRLSTFPTDVASVLLAGLSTATNAAIAATDTVLIALGKLQAQITAVKASVPIASTTTPNMDGTAAVGTSATFARADHVHPTDTSRGTVNSVVAGSGLAGGTITNSGTISLAPIAGGNLFGNAGTATAVGGSIVVGSGLALSTAGTLSASGPTVATLTGVIASLGTTLPASSGVLWLNGGVLSLS
jgi:hypothetical protein